MAFRITILMVAALAAFLLLIFNLYEIQVNKGGYYLNQAEAQHLLAGFLKAERGGIHFSDKNGNLSPVVINKDFPLVYAVPEEIEEVSRTAALLAPFADLSGEELGKRLDKRGDQYEIIVRKASESQVNKIKSLNLKGIYVRNEKLRYYPIGRSGAHVFGFVGPAGGDEKLSGRYGLELFYDDRLRGINGRVSGDRVIPPQKGEDVVLTIDRNIQAEAEKTLKNLVEKWKARGGVIIVEDPVTGKILALTVLPDFDPNDYGRFEVGLFLNPAVQSVYEPGSVFKVITMAAGIDAGKITPDTTYVDTGRLVLNGKIINNWDLKAHGRISMTEVIEKSVNTGAAFAAKTTGYEKFAEYLTRFGFGDKTGVDLPGEVSGNFSNLKGSFREINFATASFGQGVAVTPIELVNAAAAIAAGGVLKRPYLNSKLDSQIVRRVISEETAVKVSVMMESAVEKAGVAAIPNYRVAGKTGTAQVPDLKNGGYLDKFIHTYVGFAPVSNPRFVILIKLDEPEAALAGATVVPAFKNLAQFILNYYNAAPDKPAASQ